ncbi:hypothetical protein GC170_07705 [bacterium]|nr:hypothetical protein [bacterium]
MRSIAIVLTMLVASSLPESAAIELFPISTPNSEYVNGTTLMSLSGYGIGDTVQVLTQGSQSIEFSPTVVKSVVDPDNWETWGSPPATESSNPEILIHDSISPLELKITQPVKTFGFELQGAVFNEATFLVSFFDDLNEIGSIERTVNGDAGALLFAGFAPNFAFNRIVIENPGGISGGWAIANIRYSTTAVPEPSTYVLGALATLVVGAIARRNRSKTVRSAN